MYTSAEKLANRLSRNVFYTYHEIAVLHLVVFDFIIPMSTLTPVVARTPVSFVLLVLLQTNRGHRGGHRRRKGAGVIGLAPDVINETWRSVLGVTMPFRGSTRSGELHMIQVLVGSHTWLSSFLHLWRFGLCCMQCRDALLLLLESMKKRSPGCYSPRVSLDYFLRAWSQWHTTRSTTVKKSHTPWYSFPLVRVFPVAVKSRTLLPGTDVWTRATLSKAVLDGGKPWTM